MNIKALRAACFGVHPRALLNTLAVEAGRFPDPPDRSDHHRGCVVWTARMNAEFGQHRAQQVGNRNSLTTGRIGRIMAQQWPCGHPRTAENTQNIGSAGKRCRLCRRAISLKSARKRSGSPNIIHGGQKLAHVGKEATP